MSMLIRWDLNRCIRTGCWIRWLNRCIQERYLRKSSKKKKKKNLDCTVQVMERIPEHTVVSFDQEEKLNNIKI